MIRSSLHLYLLLASKLIVEGYGLVNGNSNPIHTLLLCRHGDSIWNGGQPGTKETFTGWTDVPLSQKGIKEASNTGKELSSYTYGIDACFTSILGRAKETAHHCLWAFAEQPVFTQPQKYASDYRLNERHYGALQGYVKHEVENGLLGYDSTLVKQWRRNWYAVPPLLEDHDPRRIEEVKKYGNFCGGADNVPRGESLEMVAKNRIRPFLEGVLHPTIDEAATIRNRQNKQYNDNSIQSNIFNQQGGTGLVIAHANSLRALIGVICQVEKDELALKKLEAMKIQTGVPLVMKYQINEDGEYQACAIPDISAEDNVIPDLPVWPLSCIPRKDYHYTKSKPIRIDVI